MVNTRHMAAVSPYKSCPLE